MPFFFEPKSDATSIDAVLSALELPAIADVDARIGKANELVATARSKPKPKPAKLRVGRLIVLIVLLALLLLLAVLIPNDDAKTALLDCFKVAFTAMMALLGFEASQT